MRPLSGLDASFVYAESNTAYMHTLKLLQLELPEGCAEAPLESVRAALAAWLPSLPTLRLRLLQPPLRLGRPLWHEVGEVDLDRHVEHVRLKVADGASRWRAFEDTLGAFVGRPLPRDRPLWRLLVVEGLDARRVAVAFVIHHALADGLAASQLIRRVTGEEPPGPEPPAPPARLGEGPPPSTLRLIGRGLAARWRHLPELGGLLAQTVRGILRRSRRAPELAGTPVSLFGGPALSFDEPVTPRRALALAGLPFEALHRVEERADCHLNDVVLALVAGALRRYLAERGEPVGRPLVAALPVGDAEEPYERGNRVSNLLMPIHVEVGDPQARLRAAAASAARAKTLHRLLGPRILRRWSRLARPRTLDWLWRSVRRLPRPPVNLIVSNVPGPREALWVGGARLADLHSVGPLLETTGLNLTFWSYAGRMNACVLGCPDHGTDVRAIADHLHAALAELAGAFELPRAAE
jgi:diacylglycerol O-acyltransferase